MLGADDTIGPMRLRARRWLAALQRWLTPAPPPPDPQPIINALAQQLEAQRAREAIASTLFFERIGEMIEAVHMAGSGPWKASRRVMEQSNALIEHAVEVFEASASGKSAGVKMREDVNPMSVGAYGEIELMLQNVEWRRQINLSWMEFSRWGIQQIILISRLYYLKNPICRRLVDVGAAYVFARGVEVVTNDETANATWQDFLERNQQTYGNIALTAAERGKDTDGNLFWVFFPDTQDSGKVSVRMIDSTEIADIISNPEDSTTPWFYRREWDQLTYNLETGNQTLHHQVAFHPALNYEPTDKVTKIGDYPVLWDRPVYHRKTGSVGNWKFGCPRAYPALDWMRESRKFLEACASVRQSLSQVAMTLTTKGGQQAIEGAKEQFSTTIGPSSSPFDQNPPAVRGATFASGPGSKLEAFKTSGAGFSPEDVRQYKLMCCMVFGVPETFLGDVSTGNLATATSLDRPTETAFLEKQEAWVEDLSAIATYVLKVSSGAPSGKLKESNQGVARTIAMCHRKTLANGTRVWEAFAPAESGRIEVRVNFPAIREGDVPALVQATVQSMTLGLRTDVVVGIDEKAGIIKLYDLLGIENGVELAEQQYPSWNPDRTEIVKAQQQAQTAPPPDPAAAAKTQTAKAAERLLAALDVMEKRNGTPTGGVEQHRS